MSGTPTLKAALPAPIAAPPDHPPERPSFVIAPRKESFDAELARIDESIAGVNRQKGFREALDCLASGRKCHDATE